MDTIVELGVPATAFELGQLLEIGGGTHAELEGVVPFRDRPVPLVMVSGAHDRFESVARNHRSVTGIRAVCDRPEEVLYAIDWSHEGDLFLDALRQFDGEILDSARGRSDWEFEVRFESYETLDAFRAHSQERELPVEIRQLYNPTRPEAGPWYGLTQPQRAALNRAVEAGYYKIPRQITTKDLAAEFDVSDQAMIERLRRAIGNLVANTIQLSETRRKSS